MTRALFINLPTIAFLLLFHLYDNRLEAAFAGMLLAWLVLLSGLRHPPVVRGLNLHFALIVPLLFLLWRGGADPLASWIETWAMASVVWAAAASVAYAVYRKALPGLMVLVAGLSVGWTFIIPDEQLLTIALPVILMSLSARWFSNRNFSLFFFAASMTADIEETA